MRTIGKSGIVEAIPRNGRFFVRVRREFARPWRELPGDHDTEAAALAAGEAELKESSLDAPRPMR